MSKVFKYPRTVINGRVRFNDAICLHPALNAYEKQTVYITGKSLDDPALAITTANDVLITPFVETDPC